MSYDPTPPPPNEPTRNRTPWLVALGAIVVIVLIAVGVALMAGSSDNGTIQISKSAPAGGSDDIAPGAAGISVDGDPLPAQGDDADDAAIGMPIPTIVGTDDDGNPVTIEPGNPTVIVVMAHWCPHCQAEIPRIVEWNDAGEIPDGVDVLGVSTAADESRGNYPPTSWLEKEQWPFDVLADDENTALNALGVTAFPTLIAVGADGRVALRVSGEADLDQFRALIDAARAGAPAAPTTTEPASGTAPCPTPEQSARQQVFDGPPPMCIDPAKSYSAEVTTSMGSFTIALDPAQAPKTVNNFVFLARYHYYDGIVFHRIIPGFVIQGGDPGGDGTGGPGYEFADELPDAGQYERYSLAMANSGPDTNGSQFFIITGPDGEALAPDYTLFGKVTAGTDVVDAIGNAPTDGNDRPLTDVVINTVTIVEG
jgi:cyclophilin family peptidyl-prolyl cis-trans isomerase/thiol-disulfide isomerase/thioredoxin